MKKEIKVRDSIVKSCANMVLPICLVLGANVIFHGQVTPGGGFQGGVLIAGAVAILFLAYGSSNLKKVFSASRLKLSEHLGALGFVLVAVLGLAYGGSFFANFISGSGEPGQVYSGGTVWWMNFAVGYKVLAGVGFLILIMVGSLNSEEEE